MVCAILQQAGQRAGQRIRTVARIGQAEHPAQAAAAGQKPSGCGGQIRLAPVQAQDVQIVPGAFETCAGQLQGGQRRMHPHRLRAEALYQPAANAEEERIAARQDRHAPGEDRFNGRAQGFKGREFFSNLFKIEFILTIILLLYFINISS